jgi:hypothetical protein
MLLEGRFARRRALPAGLCHEFVIDRLQHRETSPKRGA